MTYRSRPGRGSVFEVYLPEIAGDRDATTQAAPTLSGAADEDYSLLRGWRVVVIEDLITSGGSTRRVLSPAETVSNW